VACHANNEEVSQALIEDDFRRHPGIRAAQNGGKGLLSCDQFAAAGRHGGKAAVAKFGGYETSISFYQTVNGGSG